MAATLLLIGGLAMRADELRPLRDLIERHGLKTLAFDNLCVGDGPRPAEPLTIELQARHQWAQIDNAGLTDKIIIFGISMGGMIAATMVAQRPFQVDLAFLSATSANVNLNPALSDQLFQEWLTARDPKQLEKAVVIAFGKTTLLEHPEIKDAYLEYRLTGGNKQAGREFVAQLESIRKFPGEKVYQKVADSKVPVVIVSGDEDALFPESHGADMKRLLPQARWVKLKHTGHMLHLENPVGLAETLVQGRLAH